MQEYELTLIFKPELTEKQTDDIVKSLKLDVITRQAWGKRLLSYPIDDLKEGTYIFHLIKLPPDQVAELDRTLKLNEDIIRHLLVKTEPERKK